VNSQYYDFLKVIVLLSYFQNVHLVAKWLAKLEKKVEEYSTGSHEAYRLYISAEPSGTPESHIMPQGILQASIKITNEPPSGMQANLHKALDNFTQVSSFIVMRLSACYLNF
jgi:dynein heavy chain